MFAYKRTAGENPSTWDRTPVETLPLAAGITLIPTPSQFHPAKRPSKYQAIKRQANWLRVRPPELFFRIHYFFR